MASDNNVDDRFGNDISIFEDQIIIGEYGNDSQGAESGAAYIFTRTGETWTQQAKLTASDAALNMMHLADLFQ